MNRSVIFLFFNDLYIQGALITLLSFLNCYSEYFFDIRYVKNNFCYIDKNKEEKLLNILKNFKNLVNIKTLDIDENKIFFYSKQSKFCVNHGISISILTYEMFNLSFQDYQKIFYLDADLIFLKKNTTFFDNNFDIAVFPDLGMTNFAFENLNKFNLNSPIDFTRTDLNYELNAGFFCIESIKFKFKKITIRIIKLS